MTLSDEKYVSSTTYRRNGNGVATATWIVPLDDCKIGFWTSSKSGKYKRLRHDARITLQASDARGKVKASDARGKVKAGSSPVDGTAELLTTGPVFDAVQSKVKAKYGIMVPVSRFFNTLGHLGKGPFPYGDVAIVVTPEST